jgi:hypothetical protein
MSPVSPWSPSPSAGLVGLPSVSVDFGLEIDPGEPTSSLPIDPLRNFDFLFFFFFRRRPLVRPSSFSIFRHKASASS